MKIFIDFDDTIFAKSDLKKTIDRALQKHFDLSENEVHKSYADFMELDGLRKKLYTIEDHAHTIAALKNIEYHEVMSFFEKIYTDDISRYIYSDVIETLKKMRSHELILLTFGDHNFQMMKIKKCGIERYFDEVIVTQEKKYDVMNSLLSKTESMILVDDKSASFMNMKKDPRTSFAIHRVFDNTSCTVDTCDYHVTQFKEICDILGT